MNDTELGFAILGAMLMILLLTILRTGGIDVIHGILWVMVG